MNVDTSAVMRVVIENFNMTAKEMERLWAEQDKYINLLESQLRQSKKKVKKESQRVQMFRSKVIKKKQELLAQRAQWFREPPRRHAFLGVPQHDRLTQEPLGPYQTYMFGLLRRRLVRGWLGTGRGVFDPPLCHRA